MMESVLCSATCQCYMPDAVGLNVLVTTTMALCNQPEVQPKAANGMQEWSKWTWQLKEADAVLDRGLLARFTARPFNTHANNSPDNDLEQVAMCVYYHTLKASATPPRQQASTVWPWW